MRLLTILLSLALAVTVTACGRSSSDKVVEWSLAEPLTRDDVGLGSLEDTAGDTFPDLVTESAGSTEFMSVRFELPNDESFESDQARVAGASLSRLEGVNHNVQVTTDGYTLDEAEAVLLEHGARFGFDTSGLADWKTEASGFIADNDLGRLRLALNGGELDYLSIGAEAQANASSDDVLIIWTFVWTPES